MAVLGAASELTYSELPSPRSIRIIRLHGATHPDDDIHFDLIVSSVDTASYEAISYTWSGQEQDRLVYANGQRHYITKNAEDVMRKLRPNKPKKSRNLWIDAICINQQDYKEKGAQVAMMYEVYAKAQRVNIWLGHGTQETAFALKWLKRMNFPAIPLLRVGLSTSIAYVSTSSPLVKLFFTAISICILFTVVAIGFSLAAMQGTIVALPIIKGEY